MICGHMGFALANRVMVNWKHKKSVLFDIFIPIMGITISYYEWLNSVECHYDRNCTYYTNDNKVKNGIRYWKRRCVCKRKMPSITIKQSATATLRSVPKRGNGERWFELDWVHYDNRNRTYFAR